MFDTFVTLKRGKGLKGRGVCILLASVLLTSCVTTSDILTLDPAQQKTIAAERQGEMAESIDVAQDVAEPRSSEAKASETTAVAPAEIELAQDIAAKPKGFLSALLGGTATDKASENVAKVEGATDPKPGTAAAPVLAPVAKPDSAPPVPETKTGAKTAASSPAPALQAYAMDALPGVRPREQLFDIIRHNGGDGVDDIDLYEDSPRLQLAGAAGLARLAPNGLRKQGDHVDTSCFKPKLVSMIKRIEAHFGKPAVITSGYRSPQYNKKVRGATKSLHMSCDAADIHVAGINKLELARFVRGLPGRGGVGTYCHTTTVHVDIGPTRDWNWRCQGK